MMFAKLAPLTLNESWLFSEGFIHQNVNVPGPFTVVRGGEVADGVLTCPLSAAETPSWVVLASADQPNEPLVPLVVQVRFVALRACASVCPCTAGGPMIKALTASQLKHCMALDAARCGTANESPI